MKNQFLFSWNVILISAIALMTQAFGQEALPAEAHSISVGEYLILLNIVATQSDQHRLYDGEVLKREIVAQGAQENYSNGTNRTFYRAAEGIDLDSSLIGLTELQAWRYCNWVENGSQSTLPEALLTTENASYDLTGKEGEEALVNQQAEHHIMEDTLHPGCFIITTSSSSEEDLSFPQQKTSPLMMLPGEVTKKPIGENNDSPKTDPRQADERGSGAEEDNSSAAPR